MAYPRAGFTREYVEEKGEMAISSGIPKNDRAPEKIRYLRMEARDMKKNIKG